MQNATLSHPGVPASRQTHGNYLAGQDEEAAKLAQPTSLNNMGSKSLPLLSTGQELARPSGRVLRKPSQDAVQALTREPAAPNTVTASKIATTAATEPRFLSGNQVPQPHFTTKAGTQHSGGGEHHLAQACPAPLLVGDMPIQSWLDQGCYLFNLGRQDEASALCKASHMGRADIIKNILRNGIDARAVVDSDGDSPLMLAAAAGHVAAVELLLQQDGAGMEHRNAKGESALLLAVRNNHLKVVAALIENGAAIGSTAFEDGMSLLAFGAGEGHLEIVKLLLAQQQVTVDDPCPAGGPLIMAASQNRGDVVAWLLKAGANCNRRRPNDKCTALISASTAGHIEVVRMMVAQAHIDLNLAETKEGHSALARAVIHARLEVIECLLAAGASYSQLDANGCTALQLALSLKCASVLEVFIRNGRIPNDADLVCNGLDNTGYVTVIADLSADRLLSYLELPATEQAATFFKKLFNVIDMHNQSRLALQWLRKEGMSLACAHLVATALVGLRKELRARDASARRLDLCCISALSRLNSPDMTWLMLQPYVTAGISTAAVERLKARAIFHLNEIARLATEAMDTIIDQMIDGVQVTDGLINICVDKTQLDGDVRTHSLVAKLYKNAFGMPIAEAIAASWAIAVKAVQPQLLTTMPTYPSVKSAMDLAYIHISTCATTPFAHHLLHQLDLGEVQDKLQAMSGSPVDVALRYLYQKQRDRLQEYCLAQIKTHVQSETSVPKQ